MKEGKKERKGEEEKKRNFVSFCSRKKGKKEERKERKNEEK